MTTTLLPLLPLRDIVVFPGMVVPLFVGRERSVSALESAMAADKEIFLLAQLDPGCDDPDRDDLYDVGVIATVLQLLKLPDGTVRVLVEGKQRGSIEGLRAEQGSAGEMLVAQVELHDPVTVSGNEVSAMMRTVVEQFGEYAKLNKKLSDDAGANFAEVVDAALLADGVAAQIAAKVSDKQALLTEADPLKRLEMVLSFMEGELGVLQVERKIRGRVKRQMEKTQREYYLNEQLKAIQSELGGGEGDEVNELAELAEKIAKLKLSKEARAKATTELKKLKTMQPMSAEATVIRNYLDVLLGLPWGKKSKIKKDIAGAQAVLDADHYALEKVKDRIVEYLAVQARTNKLKGPILCLVGPPGVGKTSLGKSIAKATGREFVRQSLGGVRDEAEIRGHRRTYIGSMPGRLVQAIKSAGSINPVLMLDEIDKVSVGIQGDPAAALLEVLDPAQNHTFRDHYLEVPLDLSNVLFIATANQLGTIHPALLDRMEIISLSGYTEEEKLHIAKMYLIPRQRDEHGLKPEQLLIDDDALRRVIAEYTREAGVRSLERQIGALARKVAARVAAAADHIGRVTVKDVPDYLGPARFRSEGAFRLSRPGVATGLAWTEVGGDVLYIEAVLLPGGGGHLTLTGQLGSVMQESARAALSHVRQQASALGITPETLSKQDLHIHVPAGAIPKDGPSAGVTMATAIVSAARGTPVRSDVAMTGEITLSGLVLPVGGIREKSMAARRQGIKTVVLPQGNMQDLVELPEEVRRDMTFVPATTLDDVLKVALPEVVAIPAGARS
jgi:ATP-dependent Lon protease